jgi:hypothetical protein
MHGTVVSGTNTLKLCAFAVRAFRCPTTRTCSTHVLSPRLFVALAGAAQHEKFQSAPGSRVGTPAYLAPEVILTTRGKTYDGKVGHRTLQQQRQQQSNISSALQCTWDYDTGVCFAAPRQMCVCSALYT